MTTRNITFISNFSTIVHRISNQQHLGVDHVDNLLEQALRQYKLHSKKHDLSYGQLLEIWERDCEPMLYDLDLAA
jgi:hypothetical protein